MRYLCHVTLISKSVLKTSLERGVSVVSFSVSFNDHKVKMVFNALGKFIAMLGVAVTEDTDMTRTVASCHDSGHGGETEMAMIR